MNNKNSLVAGLLMTLSFSVSAGLVGDNSLATANLLPAATSSEPNSLMVNEGDTHYLLMVMDYEGDEPRALLVTSGWSLGDIDCPVQLSACEQVEYVADQAVDEVNATGGITYFADSPYPHEIVNVAEVNSSTRLAWSSPLNIGVVSIPGIGPMGPINPFHDLLALLESFLPMSGQSIESTYQTTYYLMLRVTYSATGTALQIASNLPVCDNSDAVNALCDQAGGINVPETEGVSYFSDNVDATYQVTNFWQASEESGATRVSINRQVFDFDDLIIPGIGPMGPINPFRELKAVIEGIIGPTGL